MITDLVRKASTLGKHCMVSVLDVKNAFNSVNLSCIKGILAKLGIRKLNLANGGSITNPRKNNTNKIQIGNLETVMKFIIIHIPGGNNRS